MELSFTLFVIGAIVLFIWFFIEFKRVRHKLFAIFLIALILFTFFSFSFVLKDQNVDLKSISGLTEAGKLYFSWLVYVFGNMKSITANVIKMDWSGNQTIKVEQKTNIKK